MMNIVLEFQLRPTDFRRLISSRIRWPSRLLRAVLATAVLVSGFRHLSEDGFNWYFVGYLLLAASVAVPFLIFQSIILCVPSKYRRTQRVTIDDNGFSVNAGKSKSNYPWTSFAINGKATEYRDHFWLECGRGTVWIPKRAFATDGEMAGFRSVVAEKLGERCRFDTGRS